MDFYNLSKEEVIKKTQGSLTGLSEDEAQRRLKINGYNILEKPSKVGVLKLFLRQFKNFIIYIMIVALILSLIIGGVVDAVIIGAIIILNAFLGFFQEYRAEKSIEALQAISNPKASVMRNGKIVEIDASELVVGDLLLFEEGDKIPADIYLIEINNVKTDESLLTGESVPVEKKICILKDNVQLADRKNMLFSGTHVVLGRGKGIVISTGMNSEIGKIAKMLQDTKEKKIPLEVKLQAFGVKLGICVLVLTLIIFLIIELRGQDFLSGLLVAISLAVAAIPEGLPAVVTISLAFGVQKMLKRNVLVRKLNSVETLGSTTVICSDKTGTLTKNEMTVTKIYANGKYVDVSGEGYLVNGGFYVDNKEISPEEFHMLLLCGKLCNNASVHDGKIRGDPTEAALLVVAEKGKVIENYKRVKEIPFTSESKSMSTYNNINNKNYLFMKTAPEILIKKSKFLYNNGKYTLITDKDRKELLKINDEMANNALRVLGFAYSKESDDNKLVFLGLMGMIDPARPEVKDSILICKKAGIRVVMITGDHKLTAKAIADKIGINGDVLTGDELERMDDEKLKYKIKNVNIFARVNPGHKVRILDALKKYGHIVAMTGDGVNDAPALKKADIGIAVGSGTDVAKEASDMVLRDDNFASIVAAVEEGRGIYDNIKKFINYLLSSNLAEVLVIFLAIVIGFKLNGEFVIPLLAVHLLWINLVTDGLPALALGIDPVMPGIMDRKPRDPSTSIISKNLGFNIVIIGVLLAITVLFLFRLNLKTAIEAQTVAFTALVIFEVVRLQMIRSQYNLGIFSNMYLIWAVLLSVGLQVAILYTPLNTYFGVVPLALTEWIEIIIAGLILFVVGNLVCWVVRKFTYEFD